MAAVLRLQSGRSFRHASLIRGYYLATPLFGLLDFALGASVRVAAVASPGWRLLYYALAFASGLLMRWRPRWTPFVGLAESSINIFLLVLGVLFPIFAAPARMAEGLDPGVAFGVSRLINVFLSGSVLVLSFYRHQDAIAARLRGDVENGGDGWRSEP